MERLNSCDDWDYHYVRAAAEKVVTLPLDIVFYFLSGLESILSEILLGAGRPTPSQCAVRPGVLCQVRRGMLIGFAQLCAINTPFMFSFWYIELVRRSLCQQSAFNLSANLEKSRGYFLSLTSYPRQMCNRALHSSGHIGHRER
jgi:hypothetical protein